MKSNHLISTIVIKTNEHTKRSNHLFPFDHPVYVSSIDDWKKQDKNLVRIDSKQKEKYEYFDHASIATPWVLILEDQEYLSQAEQKRLLTYVKKNQSEPTAFNIERLVPQDILYHYKWVTTRNIFENPSRDIRRYFPSEVRLVPSYLLKDITLAPRPKEPVKGRFILRLPRGDMEIADSNITISRYSKNIRKEAEVPSDQQIFKHGHQTYFDDKKFSPRFQWPHTVYHTVRLDYVPSIISALKKGLSTAQIALFTLVYLIRFREFSKASELLPLIPEHWSRRDPALLDVIATLHFINGDHETAISLYQIGVELFSDSKLLIRNAIKIHILMDRYQAIDEIILNYKETTGEELKDDYLSDFKEIHKGIPEKTATLSLCMVIKDEEKTLERAILSAKPMADEIIVVDTGSADQSSAIAEKLGAKVYHYDWHDDFSAVRNFAISKATCDYIMMLDGDEYISPFFYLDCLTLKKLFPVDQPYALNISIGSYFNETDWLFLVREAGNFRTETVSTRIFPRQSGVEYKGRIGESIDSSLSEKNIPVRIMPDSMLHIVHGAERRVERTERKCHIYKRLSQPDYPIILSAIRDFSFLGKTDETIQWLRSFYNNHPNTDKRTQKMGLKLANLLETVQPQKTEEFYKQLVTIYPEELSVVLAYGDYLLKNDQWDTIRNLPFESEYVYAEPTQKERIELNCLKSLKHFELKNHEKAFNLLTNILEESVVHVFAQTLRFYYLISMNELEGAVATLDSLFDILDCRDHFRIDSIEDMLRVVEKLCDQLLKRNYLKERSLILHGLSNLLKNGE